MARVSARVDMDVGNNATWADSFQYDDEDDTSWTLVDQSFLMEVKRSRYDADPLFTLSTDNGRIVIQDDVLRIISLNADNTDFITVLPVGEYVYDIVMIDDNDATRVQLQHGKVNIIQGVTGET